MTLFLNGKHLLENQSIPDEFKFKRLLTEQDDLNKVTDAGIYITNNHPPKNGPQVEDKGFWGKLMVTKWDDYSIWQILINNSQTNIYSRMISITTNFYPSWKRLATNQDVDKLQKQIDILKNKIGGVFKGLYIKLFSYFFDNRKVAI
ncbi:pyocin knob domain-containing protein [Lactobacillus taiwanensis]|uniref:pyocin knob domain-containing protein n=1 Tax=Lactobacillus taiwanensis TaxID=508451 RepID=UPI000B98EC88|nr:pyocin knob domain-containing protein [Lactobacillus taiwanensis]OYR95129.1 hypothetical protein CBF51_09175 [Lactobacillus taiwanensis]OYS02476.1 hypothetical protein CBF61_02250 [Lactobacillus taiwanensis]OYS16195.1 hypothetical protein CBF69_02430 [Lactobacillus taiwanensis]OYS16316.1 hypothetical protein CBF69_03125 [Lactobacillus taiwanensis]OYS32328.1 hypothetical protein CBF85_10440 [Lactobacillus taiwanensis]